jgi:hypothetical protein
MPPRTTSEVQADARSGGVETGRSSSSYPSAKSGATTILASCNADFCNVEQSFLVLRGIDPCPCHVRHCICQSKTRDLIRGTLRLRVRSERRASLKRKREAYKNATRVYFGTEASTIGYDAGIPIFY